MQPHGPDLLERPGGHGGALSELMTEENQNEEKPPRAPFLYQNWAAFAAGQAHKGTEECPLFTDAWVVGALRGLGPYDILNAVANAPTGHARPALVLRGAMHADPATGGRKGIKTDVTIYHGGSSQEEMAALLSLCSGARFRAGGLSREFEDSGDPLGTPRGFGGHVEFALPERGLRLPRATRQVHLNEDCEEQLALFPSLDEEAAGVLIRAARLYQDALWVAESEPHLAWIFLVSSIETVADYWREKDSGAVERLALFTPELIPLLKEHGGDELVEQVAKMIAGFMGATRKFRDFLLAHKPEPPTGARSPDQVPWEDEYLGKSLKIIYRWRSKALHGGIPFPAPMCYPPAEVQKGVFSERPLGLAVHTLGATWKAKDTPMLLHVFEHIVRGALLRWWNEGARKENEPAGAGQ